jgi:replicative DNA helicase
MIAWEQCVIGSVISDVGNLVETNDLLPSDFTGINTTVWGSIKSLNDAGAFSQGALIAALENTPDFKDRIEVETYVAEALTYRGPNISEYVNRVLENSGKKSLLKMAGYMASEARDEKSSFKEIVDYAETELLKLRRGKTTSLSMGDLMNVFTPRLQSIVDGTFVPAWSPKCVGVKNIIHYTEEDEFIIVAGRPGTGKSSYLRFEAYHMAALGNPIQIINMENSPIEYARSFLALRTGIDASKFKTGNLTEPENEIRKNAATALAAMPIWIDFANEIHKIRQLIHRRVAEKNIKLVVIDYIQLIRNKVEKRIDDLALSTGTLKGTAMEFKVPILAAAQLSRNIEYRTDAEPELSDLRESGSIENDANIVIFPRAAWTNPTPEQLRTFPENVNPQNHQLLDHVKAIPVIFHVKKNRNGAIGKSDPVKWNKATGNYQTLQRTS